MHRYFAGEDPAAFVRFGDVDGREEQVGRKSSRGECKDSLMDYKCPPLLLPRERVTRNQSRAIQRDIFSERQAITWVEIQYSNAMTGIRETLRNIPLLSSRTTWFVEELLYVIEIGTPLHAMSAIGDGQGRAINEPASTNTVTICQARYSQLEAASSQSRLRYDRIQVIHLLCPSLVASTSIWVKHST